MKFKSIWIGRENPNQIWTKNLSFPPLSPSPTPYILVLVNETSVHVFHQIVVVLFASPNADCTESTRDMSSAIDLSTAPFKPHSTTWIL